MEKNKATYDEIEKELEEYKTLLWQLSDEYKLNVGNAEKKIVDLEAKCLKLQSENAKKADKINDDVSEINEVDTDSNFEFIANLGMAACLIDKEGEIIKYNNKLKFFVELLSYNIEEIHNLSQLFDKATNKEISEDYELFLTNEDNLLQNLFIVKNSLKNNVNMMVRIYPFKENSIFLVMFIELNDFVADSLTANKEPVKDDTVNKLSSSDDADIKTQKRNNTIEIFAEKHEVYQRLLKVFGTKKRKKPEILPENIYIGFVRAFNLESDRQNILIDLNANYSDFADDIKKHFPRLTNNEQRHCILIKAGLSYKEIAAVMNISVNGVKIARNRLRKKLKIENETTSEFINKL